MCEASISASCGAARRCGGREESLLWSRSSLKSDERRMTSGGIRLIEFAARRRPVSPVREYTQAGIWTSLLWASERCVSPGSVASASGSDPSLLCSRSSAVKVLVPDSGVTSNVFSPLCDRFSACRCGSVDNAGGVVDSLSLDRESDVWSDSEHALIAFVARFILLWVCGLGCVCGCGCGLGWGEKWRGG